MTGPLLAAGREADVYALGERLVRRYRRDAALIPAQVAVDPEQEWALLADSLLATFPRVAPGNSARLLDGLVPFRRAQLRSPVPAELTLIDPAAERLRACAR